MYYVPAKVISDMLKLKWILNHVAPATKFSLSSIRDFLVMRYINVRFTYLLYLITKFSL